MLLRHFFHFTNVTIKSSVRSLHVFPVNFKSAHVSNFNGIVIKNTQTDFEIDVKHLSKLLDQIRIKLGVSIRTL